VLFHAKREPNYSLTTIVHFFMNRFGSSEEEVMRMDEDKRDKIFALEKEIIDAENKKNGGTTNF
jgi:hypothetical protein